MYQNHPEFEEPKDEEIKIWRYLDFTKFVSYLDRKALFFTRADKLDDRFEGKFTDADINRWKDVLKIKRKTEKIEILNSFRKVINISSWHINEYESAAMWKLYLTGKEGIAIQSTFKRLKDSFKLNKVDEIYIGFVKYIDYEKDIIPDRNIFNPFLYKRKSFEHEKELRAIIMKFALAEQSKGKHILYVDPEWIGNYVESDLSVLIENIVVSPTAPDWFTELIRSIMNKFGLIDIEIKQSDLTKDPLY